MQTGSSAARCTAHNDLLSHSVNLSINFLTSQQATGQLLLGDIDADRKTLLAGSAIYWQQLHAPAQAGSFLLVGNDDSFGVHRNVRTTTLVAASSCIWTSASELTSGLSVTAPHSFYTASRAYELRLQIDGNIVLYETSSSSIVWQTATWSVVKPSLYMTVCFRTLISLAQKHLEGTSITSQCRALLPTATSYIILAFLLQPASLYIVY
jgi:hypothetical protein